MPARQLEARARKVDTDHLACGDRHLAGRVEAGGPAVAARDHVLSRRQREAERLVVVVTDVLLSHDRALRVDHLLASRPDGLPRNPAPEHDHRTRSYG